MVMAETFLRGVVNETASLVAAPIVLVRRGSICRQVIHEVVTPPVVLAPAFDWSLLDRFRSRYSAWRLEQTPVLLPSGAAWTEVAVSYQTNEDRITVTVPIASEPGFFRLEEP